MSQRWCASIAVAGACVQEHTSLICSASERLLLSIPSCLEGKTPWPLGVVSPNSSFCGMQILWPNHHNITKSYHKIYSKQEDFRRCRKKLTIWPWSPAHLPKPTTISDDSCSAETREGDEADIGNR